MHIIDGYSIGYSQGQLYMHVRKERTGLLVTNFFCYIFVTVPARLH
jgi:hypothetical protein